MSEVLTEATTTTTTSLLPPSSPSSFRSVLPAAYHKAGLPYVFGSSHGAVTVVLLTSVLQDVSDITITWGDPYHTTTGDWLSGEWINNTNEMRTSGSDGTFRYWKAEVRPELRRLRYYFGLRVNGTHYKVCEKGIFSDGRLPSPDDSFALPYVCYADDLEAPAWSRSRIWYQIFPERFCNGDPSLDGPETIKEWGSQEPSRTNFFGGDLAGISQKLDYLEDLGVNGLYLTPIFKAPSNHKYDTVDYFQIDPHFGTNEDFKKLVEQAHERGVKVMLDAVMNHFGREHPFFKDLIQHGRKSEYWNWFHCKETPTIGENGLSFTYETFAFEKQMPKLNTRNPKVRDYLTEVGRFWIDECDIDAWRLDVANEIDHRFWRNFRHTLEFKKTNTATAPSEKKRVPPPKKGKADEEDEEADRVFFLGEVWHDALPWLDGSQFHSVMNYPLYSLIIRYFAQDRIDVAAFKNEVVRILHLYPTQIMSVLFNIIGSHDTQRALTAAGGNLKKLRLMFLFQFAFPGVPSIYYGDEVAMEGSQDPGCRRCMEWQPSEQQLKMKAFVKRLIASRQEEKAFSSPHLLLLEDDLLEANIAGASPLPDSKQRPAQQRREVVAFKKTASSNLCEEGLDPRLSPGDLLFLLNNSPAPLQVSLSAVSLLASPASPALLVPLLRKKSVVPISLSLHSNPTHDLLLKPFGFSVLRCDSP